MKIKAKRGVSLTGIQPELSFVWACVLEQINNIDPDTVVTITSVVRKKGKTMSLHPFGFAIDFTILWGIQNLNKALLSDIKQNLKKQCDIIYHDAGSGNHFHLEVDEH